MSSSLPWSLLFAWALFFGFLNTHQRHAMRFGGDSQAFLLALNLSSILGSLTAIGLLTYYFIHVAWYWPIVLFVVGSLIGGLIFGLLDGVIGKLTVSLLSFIGWPAAAVWVYIIVRGLAP